MWLGRYVSYHESAKVVSTRHFCRFLPVPRAGTRQSERPPATPVGRALQRALDIAHAMTIGPSGGSANVLYLPVSCIWGSCASRAQEPSPDSRHEGQVKLVVIAGGNLPRGWKGLPRDNVEMEVFGAMD